MSAETTMAEELARALGVTVIESDDLDGDCFVWLPDSRTVEVCTQLCGKRRERGFDQILSRLP